MAEQEYSEREILFTTASHSTVLATSLSSGKPFVLKKYVLDYDYRNSYKREIEAIVPIKHPYLISVDSCFSIEQGICVVLEQAAGGGLDKLIASKGQKKLEESFILRVLWQALSALAELHSRLLKLVDARAGPSQPLDHRFICTGNLLLTSDNTVKLSELVNLVLSVTVPRLRNDEKYNWYRAPETFSGLYSPAADIWSLGVVLYELCTYDVPFKGRNAQEMLQSMQNRQLLRVPEGLYSDGLREVIVEMMALDQDKRPKAESLLKYLLFSPFQSIPRRERVVREDKGPKKWVPKLINWAEEKENRVILARNYEEDYPFPMPGLPPVSPPSPRYLPSLREFLIDSLSPTVVTKALSIVKSLFEGGLVAKYSSKPFEAPLLSVLSREEVVKYLPLLKVLCVREDRALEGSNSCPQGEAELGEALRRANTTSKLDFSTH